MNNIRLKKWIAMMLVSVIAVCIIMAFDVNRVQAATKTEKQIQKLTDQMKGYEWEILGTHKNSTIKLTKENRAQMAVCSLDNLQYSADIYDGECSIYSASEKDFQNSSINLFGKKSKLSDLPKYTSEEIAESAFLYQNKPSRLVINVETELDYQQNSFSIRKVDKKTHLATKKVYFGYWGSDHSKSNYKIVYWVKKNSKSKYGYVIVKMKVEKI